MADYLINVMLDDDRLKKIEAAGLGDQVVDIAGKKAVQVPMSKKEQKKLAKGLSLEFDDANSCVLPEDSDEKLFGIITEMQSLDVMKGAIMKLYNPLAGKAPRAARF